MSQTKMYPVSGSNVRNINQQRQVSASNDRSQQFGCQTLKVRVSFKKSNQQLHTKAIRSANQ
eukprot:4545493-Prorocentrum_lima.AAC.1